MINDIKSPFKTIILIVVYLLLFFIFGDKVIHFDTNPTPRSKAVIVKLYVTLYYNTPICRKNADIIMKKQAHICKLTFIN